MCILSPPPLILTFLSVLYPFPPYLPFPGSLLHLFPSPLNPPPYCFTSHSSPSEPCGPWTGRNLRRGGRSSTPPSGEPSRRGARRRPRREAEHHPHRKEERDHQGSAKYCLHRNYQNAFKKFHESRLKNWFLCMLPPRT
jgi:hypothetical protein